MSNEPITKPEILVELSGWEVHCFEGWLGKDPQEQEKNANIILDIIKQYDNDAILTTEKSKTMPDSPGKVYVFKFSLIGTSNEITDMTISIENAFMKFSDNYKTYTGKIGATLMDSKGNVQDVNISLPVNMSLETSLLKLTDAIEKQIGREPISYTRDTLKQRQAPESVGVPLDSYCGVHKKTFREHTDDEINQDADAGVEGLRGEEATPEYEGYNLTTEELELCPTGPGCGKHATHFTLGDNPKEHHRPINFKTEDFEYMGYNYTTKMFEPCKDVPECKNPDHIEHEAYDEFFITHQSKKLEKEIEIPASPENLQTIDVPEVKIEELVDIDVADEYMGPDESQELNDYERTSAGGGAGPEGESYEPEWDDDSGEPKDKALKHKHPCPECGTEMEPVNIAHTEYRCPNWKGKCSQADSGVHAILCEKCWDNLKRRKTEINSSEFRIYPPCYYCKCEHEVKDDRELCHKLHCGCFCDKNYKAEEEPIEETDNEFRYRIKNTKGFDDFRYGKDVLDKGVSVIFGFKDTSKGKGHSRIQAIRFDKEKFKDKESVRKWLNEHKIEIKELVKAEEEAGVYMICEKCKGEKTERKNGKDVPCSKCGGSGQREKVFDWPEDIRDVKKEDPPALPTPESQLQLPSYQYVTSLNRIKDNLDRLEFDIYKAKGLTPEIQTQVTKYIQELELIGRERDVSDKEKELLLLLMERATQLLELTELYKDTIIETFRTIERDPDRERLIPQDRRRKGY